MKFESIIGDQTKELDFDPDRQEVLVNGKKYRYQFQRINGRYLLRMGTKIYIINSVTFEKHAVEFTLNGTWCTVEIRDEQDLLLDRMGLKTSAEIGEGQLKAPMPGKILELIVEEGDQVELGEPVAILEAMKMENELKAPISGTISHIAVKEGESVEKNILILEIDTIG